MVGWTNKNGSVLEQWYDLFKKNNNFHSLQKSAHWKKIKKIGIPNYTDEKWKNIPLKRFLSHTFVSSINQELSMSQCNDCALNLDAYRLVFINGYYSSLLSNTETGYWKITTNQKNNKILPEPIQSDFFLHLTELLNNKIIYIFLPNGKRADKPLYLLHINSGNENINTLTTSHYRHHIEIASSACGKIIEHFVSINQYGSYNGARTSIIVKDNANFSHIKLVHENQASYHFSHNDIHAGYKTKIQSNTFIILGAGITRHQTSVKLNHKETYLSINSLIFPSNEEINNIITYVEHNEEHCLSQQLHKIIACDNGRGIFDGLIKVAKNAIKSDGWMMNNNLLLDKHAQIISKPQLEIYADDVKCSHGVTIGNINEDQIFYLRTRGISYKKALKMMIYAFIYEIIEITDNTVIAENIIKHIMHILQRIIK
ncbi:Fe-S cluster assembly protein SufD [Blochmannia endosymbiont of Camponotus (Colobopsis) obliquus]|uniref:Fe-S cluster assembly protein SufD n=1 Tax=Blochmannia endosymbiont of Camponotus (Colobopsis) obliquus TaxID=1505597 RepID=UPI00061A625C|nr:Fe-S cluster assembly protein SufD [Blochmannia endosymbiont of Camponotus (Colobopsis) obliquus]AKC60524.1 FeS cluster assembly protein SufD [Blochmannia endosymbiont of Camponotus (Colobopsis) obliquus]